MRVSLVLFWMAFLVLKISCKFEFTNVKCTSSDEKFASIEYCYLKSVSRSYKYLSVKVKFFKKPRYNGYRPFMFNVTMDFCRVLGGANQNPFANYAYGFIKNNTNMNHSCPLNHDVIVEKLDTNFVNNHVTKVLPIPEVDYLLETHWNCYDIDTALVKSYATIS
ncbi:uncharacterized protein Dana_GF26302 [Drosophila ananassae]|uniref:Uncharacterized protein n=1 Tax=Drosophila ananassae TaxID=7217 RepID=A0A0P9BM80_DROAN|nr:uncharacterized protein Dana_GF26302 [Drosophila ananassae]